ncbi:hypothetical protein AFA91_29565 [Mycolicibacterium goodii]|uniref:Uncharacterized protein n=1 Tax=Mycolicibacterium goodii TaxID=134601 RepID=A0A0K0XDA6_MYCGD|nr:hypothetical protein AFA91_29565 [Mycolicibacterium goodii]
MPPLANGPPGKNRLATLKPASPIPRPGFSPVNWSQAKNSLPAAMPISSINDGSLMTARAVSPNPFQVSRSANATVPATVLITPLSTPVVRSVWNLMMSEIAPPTWSPRISRRFLSAHFWNFVTVSLSAPLSASSSVPTAFT